MEKEELTNTEQPLVDNQQTLLESIEKYFKFKNKDLLPEEQEMFKMYCLSNKLNPLLNEAYGIAFNNKENGKRECWFLTSSDVYLMRVKKYFPDLRIETDFELVPQNQYPFAEVPKQGAIRWTVKLTYGNLKEPIVYKWFHAELMSFRSKFWNEKGYLMGRKNAVKWSLKEEFPSITRGLGYTIDEVWKPEMLIDDKPEDKVLATSTSFVTENSLSSSSAIELDEETLQQIKELS